MNHIDILNNYRSFKRADLDGWCNPLHQVVEALFSEYVQTDYSYDMCSLLDKSRYGVYTLFDFPHASDESCELHVLTVDDKPVGCAFKFADKSSWDSRILNADHFRAIAREMAVKVMDQKLQAVTEETLGSLNDFCNSYIHFLDKNETMFAVQSPKWMYGFAELVKAHRAFIVNAQGVAQEISNIGSFVNSKPSYTSDPDTHNVTVTVNGQELIVDGTQVMFELLAGQGNIADAVAAFTEPACWCVDTVLSHMSQVHILQHVPGQWTTQGAYLAFANQAEYEKFVAVYGTTDSESKASRVHDGVFDPQSLGFSAKLSHSWQLTA
jgi:hypothetical protein